MKCKYDLVVIAVDGAPVGFQLTGTTTVHIEITGVNEFPPKWDATSTTNLAINEGDRDTYKEGKIYHLTNNTRQILFLIALPWWFLYYNSNE